MFKDNANEVSLSTNFGCPCCGLSGLDSLQIDIEYVGKNEDDPTVNFSVKPQQYEPNGAASPATKKSENPGYDLHSVSCTPLNREVGSLNDHLVENSHVQLRLGSYSCSLCHRWKLE